MALVEQVKSEVRLGIDLGLKLLPIPYRQALQSRQWSRLNLAELRRYDLVCFDLFDTLVRRRIDPPDYLKGAVALYVARLVTGRTGVAVTAAEIQSYRDQSERTLRQRARDQGRDPECRHEELMSQVLALGLGRPPSDAELGQVLDFELQMEQRALAPNPAPCALMAQAKAAGLRVIVASDMYLSGKQLLALIDALGVPRPDALYASADLLLCKGSGRLFRHILATEGVRPERMIHIGDNPGSDVRSPRQLGITAVRYYDGREQVRRLVTARTLQRVQQGHRPSSALPVELERVFTPTTPVAASAAYELGHRVLGPVYCVYLHRVMLRAAELGIEQLHFVAREGYLLQQIYAVLDEEMHPQRRPVLHYTHLSRLATSLPVLARFGIHQLKLLKSLDEGVATVLKCYGLYDDEVLSTLPEADRLQLAAPVSGWSDARLQRILQVPALQKIIAARAGQAHELLRKYLAAQGFFSCRRAALVDVGWSGTIQNNLVHAFSGEPGFPELFGLYLALIEIPPALHQPLHPSIHKEGLLYDYRTAATSLNDRAPFWFEELLELAAQAPHGTTLGYQQRGERVEPVLKDGASHGSADRTRAAVAEIQRGILDYTRAYGRFAELGNISIEQQTAAAKREMARFIFHPSARSLDAIAELMHDLDWGQESALPLLGQGSLRDWLAQGPASLARFSGALWKHGEARRLGGPLLGQLYYLYTWCRY